MAINVTWSSYSTISTILTTELDAANFANNAQSITAAIDNTSALDFRDDLELTCTFAATPSAGAKVEIYLLIALDGTNYADGTSGVQGGGGVVIPASTAKIGFFPIRADTNVQRVIFRAVRLPPGFFKYLLVNKTGVASSGTSNTLKRRSYHQLATSV